MTPAELQSSLRQFTGTEQWWRHQLGNLVYTDGVKYFAQKAGAYWFLDIVATEIEPKKLDFATISLVSKDNKGSIEVDDGNSNTLFSKAIEFTDAPAGTWRFFIQDNIILLPSEY